MKTLTPETIKKLKLAGYGEVGEEGSGLVLTIQGQPGVGKTALALAAPGRIAYVNFDEREEGTIQVARDAGKSILPVTFPYETTEGDDDGRRREVWGRVRTALLTAVEAGVRTIVVDTETEMWELKRLSEFGKLMAVPEIMYPRINMDYLELLKKLRRAGNIVILVRRVKAEYGKDNKATGRMVAQGMNKVSYLEDAAVEALYEPPVRKADGTVQRDQRFGVRILEAKQNKGMIGQVLWGIDFPTLASMLKPNVDASAWEDQ